MTLPVAVYLDLTDHQSARVWRWLRLLPGSRRVQLRPFSNEVADPWECQDPPFSLELLMLLEQARDHGEAALIAVVDAAFERLGPELRTAVGELSAWLAIGAIARLPLAEYDHEMQRLRGEVGYWMAEARHELAVQRAPTLLCAGGEVLHLELAEEIDDRGAALQLMDRIQARLAGLDGGAGS